MPGIALLDHRSTHRVVAAAFRDPFAGGDALLQPASSVAANVSPMPT
jgi:hypothetical protein